ncbi:hypothetical protein CIHG_00350 [Coccidioides immitis H538.4]|uniref:Uncharacterized protein n=3 Tax=Coccidioides immitis TaxID=5501 RepID=A0A0J8QHY5_COCIT|nr:hypothetical protein CIRG_07171 [Coccidioides immitis RMSCC 2394]KMU72060.1 hypothetical protein CISG_00369 [Coccidioides immitis RMSCC 3703]KMU82569.1 hypothetical protein CIHG_00350 [Coccidioides immitis H538.4]
MAKLLNPFCCSMCLQARPRGALSGVQVGHVSLGTCDNRTLLALGIGNRSLGVISNGDGHVSFHKQGSRNGGNLPVTSPAGYRSGRL